MLLVTHQTEDWREGQRCGARRISHDVSSTAKMHKCQILFDQQRTRRRKQLRPSMLQRHSCPAHAQVRFVLCMRNNARMHATSVQRTAAKNRTSNGTQPRSTATVRHYPLRLQMRLPAPAPRAVKRRRRQHAAIRKLCCSTALKRLVVCTRGLCCTPSHTHIQHRSPRACRYRGRSQRHVEAPHSEHCEDQVSVDEFHALRGMVHPQFRTGISHPGMSLARCKGLAVLPCSDYKA